MTSISPAPINQPRAGGAFKHLLALVLALAFLWFAFKNANVAKLLDYARGIKVPYLFLLAVSGITSHILRAKRWVLLLSPLRDDPVRLWNSFCAVMIGYAVNIVLPRGGEIARLVAISKEENLSWVGVLPTMLIDRLLDLAMLAILLGLALFQLPENLTVSLPWIKTSGLGLIVLSTAGLIILPFLARILKVLVPTPVPGPAPTSAPTPVLGSDSDSISVCASGSSSLIGKIHNLAEEFEMGTRSLRNPIVFPAIAGLSLAMWLCYWLNLYLMVLAFGLEKIVSIPQSLQAFTIASFGVLVPTPASLGSYHLLLSKTLMALCGLNQDLALAFATVLHLFSFVIVSAVTAAFCVLVNGFYKSRWSRN